MMEQLTADLHSLISFEKIAKADLIQSLWSGYGQLYRLFLEGTEFDSIIVKRIAPPLSTKHPRGWHTNTGHQRKLHSYKVESYWYQHYAALVNSKSVVPKLLAFHKNEEATLLVLEDLNAIGYPLRKDVLSLQEIKNCLRWLANFHGQFMQTQSDGLWPVGTYWHLDTRPDELEAMPNGELKLNAQKIDGALNNAQFKTLVHGDAKYANFCFSPLHEVAAVDFQYVGSGCGMKDVAYLFSCQHNGMPSLKVEQELLSHYFNELKLSLKTHHPHLDFDAIKKEWTHLYPIAWADFERFLQGWSPGHWKSSSYSQHLVKQALLLV